LVGITASESAGRLEQAIAAAIKTHPSPRLGIADLLKPGAEIASHD
jgi:hypothetical protein